MDKEQVTKSQVYLAIEDDLQDKIFGVKPFIRVNYELEILEWMLLWNKGYVFLGEREESGKKIKITVYLFKFWLSSSNNATHIYNIEKNCAKGTKVAFPLWKYSEDTYVVCPTKN